MIRKRGSQQKSGRPIHLTTPCQCHSSLNYDAEYWAVPQFYISWGFHINLEPHTVLLEDNGCYRHRKQPAANATLSATLEPHPFAFLSVLVLLRIHSSLTGFEKYCRHSHLANSFSVSFRLTELMSHSSDPNTHLICKGLTASSLFSCRLSLLLFFFLSCSWWLCLK